MAPSIAGPWARAQSAQWERGVCIYTILIFYTLYNINILNNYTEYNIVLVYYTKQYNCVYTYYNITRLYLT